MSRVASRGSEVEDRMSRVIGRGWESRGRQSKVQGQNLSVCMFLIILNSLRSRRYSRAQEEKLEIPLAQKLSILSSAHRAHGSAHTNVFALENQSERESLIMLLAGLQCSKRCQFNNCFVFFCPGEQNNSYETFAKAYTVNIMLFPNPVGKIALTLYSLLTLQDDGSTDSR